MAYSLYIIAGLRILLFEVKATLKARRYLILQSVILFFVAMAILAAPLHSACTPQSESGIEPVASREVEEEAVYSKARETMVEKQIRARGISNSRILAVMARVPRHRFVPEEYVKQAYEDHPLPIGFGQTISQPYIVALMTELLELEIGDKVLEIGTGSGYQAAILAELTDWVYTIEIIEPLSQQAESTLKELGYDVHIKTDDGYYGWPEHGPFDAIIVTCASDHVPQPLIKQLKDGGRMVIPVGPPGHYQTLWLIEKRGEQLKSTNMGSVIFVPMVGEH
jgi:protein-L-isoaspartate(D-aspartate) O-methyltransferase